MSHINVGISAIRAAQVGLNTTGHNIANAATDGYHRQRVDRKARLTAHSTSIALYGGGVDVSGISRMRNSAIEQALTSNISGREAAASHLTTLQQVESTLTPGDGSIHTLVTQFFNQVEQLAANPAESVLRRQLTATATQLGESISAVTVAFDSYGATSEREIRSATETANDLAKQVSEINREIRIASSRDQSTNQLLDQRDLLINELAAWVDIDPNSLLTGGDPLIAAGGALIIGEITTQMEVVETTDGKLRLNSTTGQTNIEVHGGKLAGMFEAAKAVDVGIGADFAEWASTLLREIDTIQATGIGLNGPANALTGTRAVTGIDDPLATARGLYEIQSGQISVTMTDGAGQRRTTLIEVDVDDDSLRDVVERLDDVDGLRASVSAAGTVSLHAADGYSFDFSGRPDPVPLSTQSGTAVATVSGTFHGDDNDVWVAEVVNQGEVGVSTEVIVQVRSEADGRVVKNINVGQGYAANEPVEVADGIKLQFSSGQLQVGDRFTFNATGQPDSTGLLATLGLGTMFSGNSLHDVHVSAHIERSPDNIAASQNGFAGEGRQLDRLIDLRGKPLFTAIGETVEERLSSLTGLSGTLVSGRQAEIDQRNAQAIQLENARDAESGVDPNEELLQMLQFQQAFQAASRFVTTVDEALNDLINTLGR